MSRNVESNYLHSCHKLNCHPFPAKGKHKTQRDHLKLLSFALLGSTIYVTLLFSSGVIRYYKLHRRPCRGKSNHLSYLSASRLHPQYSRLWRRLCFHRRQRSFPHWVSHQRAHFRSHPSQLPPRHPLWDVWDV